MYPRRKYVQVKALKSNPREINQSHLTDALHEPYDVTIDALARGYLAY